MGTHLPVSRRNPFELLTLLIRPQAANSGHTVLVVDRPLSDKHMADEDTRVSAIEECGLPRGFE